MRIATILLAMSIGAAPASAQWQDASGTDPKGKKIAMQRTPGKGQLVKSGRQITSNLYVRCDNPFDDRIRYRGHDYWSVFVLFSEPVGSAEAPTRYSFDGGQSKDVTFMLNQPGTAIFLMQQDDDNEFITQLAKSNTLQISPALTWAGSPTITFETTGAAEALKQIPCNKKF
jgi:hypothetical protein